MRDIERSLGGVERSSKSAQLQTGRLGNQFASLAGQIAHVHPVVGNLAGVLGNFVIGAGLTVGILAGVAAIAVVYDRLTKATREAKEEQDKLIKSLERSIHLKGLGPGGETVDQVGAARDRAAALKTQIEAMKALIVKDAQDADVIASNLVIQDKLNKLYIERQNILNTMAGGQSIVNEKVKAAIAPIQSATTAVQKYTQAVQEAAIGTEFWKKAMNFAGEVSGPGIAQLTMDDARRAMAEGIGAEFEMPNVKPLYTKEQFDDLMSNANQNAQLIRGAIAQSAQIIVSALNIGGGGKGSGLGGALGSTAGFALGFGLGGPIGGAIGSTIGTIAGSFFGGLFDNKKAIDTNTQALRANTAAMLLYAPAGFRAESYRYNASDPRPLDAFGRAVRWNASRGGANPLLGT